MPQSLVSRQSLNGFSPSDPAMKKTTSIDPTIRLLAFCVVFVLSASVVSAASFVNYESPVYVTGSIVGQDGWTSNSYGDFGNTAPNANIVAAGALSGSQSVSIIGAVGPDTF